MSEQLADAPGRALLDFTDPLGQQLGIALGFGQGMLASAFVGYWVRGVIGAVVASIAIFACSFIIVLAAAQYRDAIIASKLARKALSGVLATLGGMIVVVSITLAQAVHWGWPQGTVLVLSLIALAVHIPVPVIVLGGAGLSMDLGCVVQAQAFGDGKGHGQKGYDGKYRGVGQGRGQKQAVMLAKSPNRMQERAQPGRWPVWLACARPRPA